MSGEDKFFLSLSLYLSVSSSSSSLWVAAVNSSLVSSVLVSRLVEISLQ